MPSAAGVALAILGIVALADNRATAQSLPSAWVKGIATNYGGPHDGMDPGQPSFGTSVGACGYGLLDKTKFPYWSVGALSTSNSFLLAGPQSGCGECFEVRCVQDGGQYQGRCNQDPNSRSVTLMITDVCPECEPDHLDIQAITYNKIAPIALGRIDIQYRRVACVPPSGLTINVDQNYGAGNWLRMTIQKAAGTGSIKLVQVKGTSSGWQDLQNKWGASWEMPQSPTPPLDLRVVSSDGSEVTAFGFINANGEKGVLPVGVNFAAANNPGVTAITTLPGTGATDISAAVSHATSSISSNFGGGASASASSSSEQVTAFEGPSGNSPDSPPPPGPQASPPPYWMTSPPPPPPPSSSSGGGSSSQPSPPPPPPSSDSSGGSSWSCTDNQPPGTSYSCAQQKQWGNCYASWMTASSSTYPKGYCAKTCGRC